MKISCTHLKRDYLCASSARWQNRYPLFPRPDALLCVVCKWLDQKERKRREPLARHFTACWLPSENVDFANGRARSRESPLFLKVGRESGRPVCDNSIIEAKWSSLGNCNMWVRRPCRPGPTKQLFANPKTIDRYRYWDHIAFLWNGISKVKLFILN